ncbi:MAG: hypothetical protein J2P19_18795 [Pseudonocardia sp.]|nr:hypothetical protein [Pseudonocardia sp.]
MLITFALMQMPGFDRNGVEALIMLTAIIGLYSYSGTTGIPSFGHVGFATSFSGLFVARNHATNPNLFTPGSATKPAQTRASVGNRGISSCTSAACADMTKPDKS